MGTSIETNPGSVNQPHIDVRYTGPDLDSDATLAELVGLPRWFLELEADFGDCTLRYRSRLAGDTAVTGHEWHGHARAWIVPIMGADDARQLVDKARPLVAKVIAGYRSEWNGSNHVARFDSDAEAALGELDRMIEQWRPAGNEAGLWSAGDWFEQAPPEVSATATDAELAALAAELQADAHDHGVHLYDLDEYLTAWRAEAQEGDDE